MHYSEASPRTPEYNNNWMFMLYIFYRVHNSNNLLNYLEARTHTPQQGCRFVSVVGGGGGMIGAKIFSAMDQSNHEVEACGKLHPSQARSQDFILGGGSEHAKRGP